MPKVLLDEERFLACMKNDRKALAKLNENQPAPYLMTVKQFAEKHPAFPQGGLRHFIFNEETNGLKEFGAIVRFGGKK